MVYAKTKKEKNSGKLSQALKQIPDEIKQFEENFDIEDHLTDKLCNRFQAIDYQVKKEIIKDESKIRYFFDKLARKREKNKMLLRFFASAEDKIWYARFSAVFILSTIAFTYLSLFIAPIIISKIKKSDIKNNKTINITTKNINPNLLANFIVNNQNKLNIQTDQKKYLITQDDLLGLPAAAEQPINNKPVSTDSSSIAFELKSISSYIAESYKNIFNDLLQQVFK